MRRLSALYFFGTEASEAVYCLAKNKSGQNSESLPDLDALPSKKTGVNGGKREGMKKAGQGKMAVIPFSCGRKARKKRPREAWQRRGRQSDLTKVPFVRR